MAWNLELYLSRCLYLFYWSVNCCVSYGYTHETAGNPVTEKCFGDGQLCVAGNSSIYTFGLPYGVRGAVETADRLC